MRGHLPPLWVHDQLLDLRCLLINHFRNERGRFGCMDFLRCKPATYLVFTRRLGYGFPLDDDFCD